MKITRVDVMHINVPMTTPFKKAGRVQHEADNALVRIESDAGVVGWGEAASAPLLTGETGARIAASATELARRIIGEDPRSISRLHQRASEAMAENTSAVCAIDIALHDLVARAAGLPVFALLGGRSREELPAARGLNADDSGPTNAASAAADGIGAFKVKVSIDEPGAEQAALREIRAAVGPDASLAIDANGNWRSGDALRFLDAVGDLAIDFCEQPVAPGNLGRMERIAANSPVPIYADESMHVATDLIDYDRIGVAGVSMKPIKMGGITGFMESAALARMLDLGVNVAGKEVGSSIAGAALLHIGTAMPTLAGGISLSNHKLVEDLVANPVGMADGSLRISDAPGLGVDVDEGVVDRVTVHRESVTG